MSERLIEVKGCARCGGEHVLPFLSLRRPCGPYSYWAQCPTTLEPVLMLERPLSLWNFIREYVSRWPRSNQ